MPDQRHQQRHQHGQQGNQQQSLVEELKRKIQQYPRLKEIPAEELVNIAEKLGKHLKDNDLKTTQIRRFLDGVRRIDVQFKRGRSFNKDSVILLKPKLAYAAGRQAAVKPLMDVLNPAITAGAESYESFKKLIALIEGIIAYHRFYGGKDS